MNDNAKDIGNFLAGFIIGGLIGAAAAILMAPQSGEETRTLIRDKGIELREKAAESAEDARLRAEEAVEEMRLRADEVSQKARERAAELQERGKVVIDQQKESLEQAKQAGASAVQSAKDQISSEPPADAPTV